MPLSNSAPDARMSVADTQVPAGALSRTASQVAVDVSAAVPAALQLVGGPLGKLLSLVDTHAPCMKSLEMLWRGEGGRVGW